MSPRISVIVPAYNYGHFIGETIASVQQQIEHDWECIVVDDGSTDDTWQVVGRIARSDPRVRYLRRTNGGLAAARNTGLAAARGRYLQFLDADDLLEAHKLMVHAAYLDANPSVGIVYGDVRYFPSERPDERRRALFDDVPWMSRASGGGDAVLRVLIRGNIMVVNAPLLRRTVVDLVGGFGEHLPSLEDWDYWLRCAAAGVDFRFLDAEGTLSLVRVHARSMSQDRFRMMEQQIWMRRAIGPGLRGEIYLLNRWHLSEELGQLGLRCVEQGRRLEGLRHLAESRWTRPGRRGTDWIGYAARAMLPNRESLRARLRGLAR